MSGPAASRDASDTWARAMVAVGQLVADLTGLARDGTPIPGVRRALERPEERPAALSILGLLDTSYTAELVDTLVSASLSHRDALAVREVLGRLTYREAQRIVPPAVDRQLARTPDDDAYRRLAELLDHLGLARALRLLAERALASDDPDIREVGEDFA